MFKVAAVIVDNSSREMDRAFDYGIPVSFQNKIRIGMRVVVPFGNGNKKLEGYVIELKNISDYPIERLKNIEDIIEDEIIFTDEMIELACYLKEEYNCTYLDAFRTIIPSGINLKENTYIKLNKNNPIKIEFKYQDIVKHLAPGRYINLKAVNKALGKNLQKSLLNEMERIGVIEIKSEMEQSVGVKTQDIYVLGEEASVNDFIINPGGRYKRQAEILSLIKTNRDNLCITDLCKKYGCSPSLIKSLEEKGLLIKKTVELTRSAFNKEYSYPKPVLTMDQQSAVGNILEEYKKGNNISLIHGVTGCGKTEIYLELVERFIDKGFDSIILVPEISLTPQTVERFRGRFGDTVAVLHSRLSEGERFDEWRRIKKGQVKVVVGARSAVFAPLENLKLIIIDEEHEYSYKSEVTPKYHTRNVAEYRAGFNKGLLVLGSATPSLESYHRALKGDYNLVEIAKRVDSRKMPQIMAVDMREELKNGNKSMFSRELFFGIKENLEKKQQTIIFLNRRGFSSFISCRSCGHVIKCSNCDVSLTYHMSGNRLMCHYCGIEDHVPAKCPSCGSKYIKHFGAGTEKVESEIKRYFPSARVLRMDLDTTRKKGDHERIYNQFKSNEADILIGTQMISKGMDFSDVTLVGVIAADISLNLPDFRASERTFQLITQVAGRAGRGDKEGRVIVQTYEPEHYSISFAKEHDYISFYNREIELRRILNNPPFSDILYVSLVSEKEEELIKYSMLLKGELKDYYGISGIDILGPTPCQISKIKNNYRWHMIFKGNVKIYYNEICEKIYMGIKGSSISCGIDINPYSMY